MAGEQHPTPRATRADVARLANVSTAAVSYVLNGAPNKISEATAARVRAAADQLNYRPSSLAQALRTGSARMFGVVVPDLSNPYFAESIEAIELAASARGYATVMMTSHADRSAERARVGELATRAVDAILISSARLASELSSITVSGIPLVLLDRPEQIDGVRSVSTDFDAAVFEAVQHLFSHGHRHIAMLSGSDQRHPDVREDGWRRAYSSAGLPVGPIVATGYTREGGYRATLRAFEGDDRPTAVFASSDLEALGALRAFHELGLRVPEDVALISFDGTVDSQYTVPPLTTMRQRTHELARLAVDAALDPDATGRLHLVPADLVIRQSCGC